MSQHAQLVFAVGFAAIAVLTALGFVGWLAWSLCWDMYDGRKRKRRLKSAQGCERVAFRDRRGLTK